MKPYDFKKRRTSCLQPKWAKYILCFLLFLAMHPSTFAKEAFSLKIRRFLNPISFNIASGFGINYYENTILGLMIFDQDGNHYLVDKETDNTMYLVRWMGQPYIRLKSYDNLKDLLPPKNLAGDKVVFSGTGMTFPINLSAHIDILKKVRLELGGSLIINKIKTLQPDENHEFLDDYVDPVGTHYVLRPFILLGFKVLEKGFIIL